MRQLTSGIHRRAAIGAVAVGAGLVLAGCGSGDPLDSGSSDGGGTGTIVIGSQAYYSNDIIAEIYAQALEDAGFEVQRQFQIGQRDVYLEAMESGEVQLFPEYTGNLLQYYDSGAEARSPEDIAAALPDVLPDGLAVLDYAEAQDGDSYNVTSEFSAENGVTSLADLAGYDGTITIGGNAELESRPYGPAGLSEFYGVDVGFVAIRDGTITMGDIYSADPDLASGDFVTLEDPEGMILAQNVVPLVRADIADEISDVINAVSAQLSTEDLIALNASSVVDQLDAATIATDWLTTTGLL